MVNKTELVESVAQVHADTISNVRGREYLEDATQQSDNSIAYQSFGQGFRSYLMRQGNLTARFARHDTIQSLAEDICHVNLVAHGYAYQRKEGYEPHELAHVEDSYLINEFVEDMSISDFTVVMGTARHIVTSYGIGAMGEVVVNQEKDLTAAPDFLDEKYGIDAYDGKEPKEVNGVLKIPEGCTTYQTKTTDSGKRPKDFDVSEHVEVVAVYDISEDKIYTSDEDTDEDTDENDDMGGTNIEEML
jgi:hypothetical protein